MKPGLLTVAGCFLFLLQGCAPVNAQKQTPSQPFSASASTFVFNCSDGFDFVARTSEDGVAWLFLPSDTLKLEETTPGTYRLDAVKFKIDGQQGLLEEPGGNHQACQNNRRQAIWEHAKLSGADFRAIGNEPGWNLEIRYQSKLILISDYGKQRREFDLPEPQVNPQSRSTFYKISQSGQPLSLVILGEECRDTMSGEKFSSKVEVRVDGKTLRGCGRALY